MVVCILAGSILTSSQKYLLENCFAWFSFSSSSGSCSFLFLNSSLNDIDEKFKDSDSERSLLRDEGSREVSGSD